MKCGIVQYSLAKCSVTKAPTDRLVVHPRGQITADALRLATLRDGRQGAVVQQDGGAVRVVDGGPIHQLRLVAEQARPAKLGLVHQALDVRHLHAAKTSTLTSTRTILKSIPEVKPSG